MRDGRLSQVILTAIIGSMLGLAALQSQGAPPKPCATAEYRQFDFWIGEWTVTNPEGKVVGTNVIERVAGGCGLQETWTASTGGSGRSLNAYSPQDGKWHQIWLGSGGLWMPLSGGLRDGSMVLEGRTLDREKKAVHQRITWTPQEDGRVRQVWGQSKDGGRTWTAGFDGMYTKRKNAEGTGAQEAREVRTREPARLTRRDSFQNESVSPTGISGAATRAQGARAGVAELAGARDLAMPKESSRGAAARPDVYRR